MADLPKIVLGDNDVVRIKRGRGRNSRGTITLTDDSGVLVAGVAYGVAVTPPQPTPEPVPVEPTPVPAPVPVPVPVEPGTPPANTTQPQAAAVSGGTRWAWGAVPGAIGYRLSWGLSAGGGDGALTVTGTEATIPLTESHWFCVQPYNDAGTAPDASCNSFTGTVPAPPPAPITPAEHPTGGGGSTYYERRAWPLPFAAGGDIVGAHGTVVVQNGGEFLRSTWTTGGPWVGAETHGVDLSPPNARVVRPREVWLDTALREIGTGWGATSDDKTIFVIPDYSLAGGADEQSRWAIYLRGSNGPWYGGPYPENGVPDYLNFQASPRRLFDGQKHRVRLHFKMASNVTATDGIFRVWLDDELVCNHVGILTGNPAGAFFRVVALGRNVDPGPGCSRDWYGVTIHTANPGW